jgi:hypothetical protein
VPGQEFPEYQRQTHISPRLEKKRKKKKKTKQAGHVGAYLHCQKLGG